MLQQQFRLPDYSKLNAGARHTTQALKFFLLHQLEPYFEEALKSVRKRSGNLSDLSLERVNSYRVHTYEVLSSLVADNGREGLVTVKIDYYPIGTGVIKTVIDRQKWWFGDTTQTWYLEHFFLAD